MAQTLKFGAGEWATKEGSTLAYNDENGNFKPLPFNFERAGSATRVNKEGLIEVVSNNEPRIDFKDNTKGALLLEPSRSNLITYSENYNTWNKAALTNSSVTEVNPQGTTSTQKITQTSSGGFVWFPRTFTGNETFSVFVKKDSSNFARLYAANNSVYFDIVNGTITNEIGSEITDKSIIDYGNGWFRISISVNSTASNVRIYPASSGTSSNGTNSLFVYGAQLEQGSYATSYIPTSGGIATRNAESSSQTVPDGVIGQTEGTIFVDFKFKGLPNNVSSMPISIDGSGSNEAYIYIDVNNTVYGQFIVGGSFTCNISGDDLILGNTYKIAFAYKNSDFALFVNGVLSNSSNSGVVGANQNIVIGNYLNGNYPHDNINEAKLYNTRLSNSELVALTS
jgi:hypothetical protein